MIYPRWLKTLSRADFLYSAGLYVMRDRLFLVRARKNLFRVSVLEEEMREIPHAEDAASRRLALSETIRSLLPHFDPARDGFYLCFSPDQAIAVQLLLPQAAAENLAQVVEYEIGRQLPFRPEEVYYDFLPMGKKGDKLNLFLFAVPKIALDEIADILATFGVKPAGVETTATALVDYLLFCSSEFLGPAVVVGSQDHTWEMIGLNAKRDGWKQEAEILFTHWLPQARWVEGPGKEIFRGYPGEPPRLFGWGYIQDFLSSVKAESLQFEDLLALGRARLAAPKGLEHFYYIPAIGAALRGLREASFQINLLPGSRQRTQGRMLSRLNAALAALLVLGLIAWAGSYPLKDEIRLRQFQKENQKLMSPVGTLRQEEEELNRVRKEVSVLSGLSERRGEVLQVLDELSRIVPNSAYLSSLRYREGILELQGTAENASNLVPTLERSPVFENVGFTAPSARGRDNRDTFSLKASIEKTKGKASKQ